MVPFVCKLPRFFGLLLLLCALMAGCVPAQVTPEADAPPPEPTEEAAVDAVDTVDEPQRDLTGVTIVYHKSGCFDGVDFDLTVYADGRLVLVDREGTVRERQVQPEQLDALNDLLADPAWEGVSPRYQAAGADLCVYSFMIPVAGGAPREVTTMDAAQHPAIVETLREEMDRLLALARNP